jgi:hypothetical protein
VAASLTNYFSRALLPLVVRYELGGSPTDYGVLLGCFGADAVSGAVVYHSSENILPPRP